jgi:hypothetical protein
LAVANSSAAAFDDLRSMSTALLSSISLVVSSAAETLSSAAMSWGDADFLWIAGTTLSVFCRVLSSVRTMRVSPATGAQPLPAAELGGAAVPDDPDSPQPARMTAAVMRVPAVRRRCRRMLLPPSVSRHGQVGRAACPDGHSVFRRPCGLQLPTARGRPTFLPTRRV